MLSVVSQFTHYGLLWRPALSVLHSVYRFVQQDKAWDRWWPSAWNEFELMRGILPLLELDIGKRICPWFWHKMRPGPAVRPECTQEHCVWQLAVPRGAAGRCD